MHSLRPHCFQSSTEAMQIACDHAERSTAYSALEQRILDNLPHTSYEDIQWVLETLKTLLDKHMPRQLLAGSVVYSAAEQQWEQLQHTVEKLLGYWERAAPYIAAAQAAATAATAGDAAAAVAAASKRSADSMTAATEAGVTGSYTSGHTAKRHKALLQGAAVSTVTAAAAPAHGATTGTDAAAAVTINGVSMHSTDDCVDDDNAAADSITAATAAAAAAAAVAADVARQQAARDAATSKAIAIAAGLLHEIKLLFLEVMALAEPGYTDDTDAAATLVQQYTATAGLDCKRELTVLTAFETEVSLHKCYTRNPPYTNISCVMS
jgi:hypothetical protein